MFYSVFISIPRCKRVNEEPGALPTGLFLFLLAVHQISNDFCHKEKQHANSGLSLPFISPLGSPPCTTRLVPSAGSPSFKCRSAPVLLLQSLSCCWEVAIGFFFFSCLLWFGCRWQGAIGEMPDSRSKVGVGGGQRILEGNEGYFGC